MNWHWLTWSCSFNTTINTFWTVRLHLSKQPCVTYPFVNPIFLLLTRTQVNFWPNSNLLKKVTRPQLQRDLQSIRPHWVDHMYSGPAIINTLSNRYSVLIGWIEINLTITKKLRSWLVLDYQVTSKRISQFFRLYIQNRKLLRSNENIVYHHYLHISLYHYLHISLYHIWHIIYDIHTGCPQRVPLFLGCRFL